jgi:DNA-binding NtrC family response regulator
LYYRLNVFHIHLPPLRDRTEDIPLIATTLIEKLNKKHGTRVTHLDTTTIEALKAHRWDGNVRELRNVIERALILAGEGPILRTHLYMPSHRAAEAAPASHGLGIQVGMSIDEAERVLIEATLNQTKNNKTRAATTLGISAKTLHAKLKQYRLHGADDDSDQTESAGV